MEKKYSLSEFGYKALIKKFAKNADGSVWLQQGGTVVLAAVVSAPADEFLGFFPLTIDYREQFAATGKIPGGYLKREGRPTDKEVLTGRLIDRALRPLFPDIYFDKVQIAVTVYSVDSNNMPGTLALLAASLALEISHIPFMGPVGACEMARVQGVWVMGPSYEQIVQSDAKIIVAGNAEGVNMVEGSAAEISEEEFVDVMFQAHECIKKQVMWQEDIRRDLGVASQELVDTFDTKKWIERAADVVTVELVAKQFGSGKKEQKQLRDTLKNDFLSRFASEILESGVSQAILGYAFDTVLKQVINELIFERGNRLDLRDFETIRSISTEVGLLPLNHGSSLFTRGGTQALTSVTLGGGQDQMRVDDIMGDISKSFMLHYNFPSFAVGEARPSRGVGRREVGHGYLALAALESMLPSQEHFGYTIRVVADILESDGSSSMATVCGTTMALMNAGVPLKKMVSGIAMGLLISKKGQFQVISDIAGVEDAFGMMDFKVAGTEEGITAIQMDVKYKSGLTRDFFEKALSQAKRGRLHIMSEMKKVMSEPNKELSSLVPQIISFKIPKDKIGAVIGSGGKIIRDIIEKTSTTIDIEDDGLVKILGHPGPGLDKAVAWVKLLGGNVDLGVQYQGIVKRIAEFGIFVEIAPGQDGLVHVSTVPRSEQDAFMRKFKEGESVKVEILDYDKATGRIRLKIIQ